MDDRITYIGRTNHRNAGTLFGIRQRDRRSHFYVIGKTGTGKSHLLRIMLEQDMDAGQGCALFDPHGDLAGQLRKVAEDAELEFIYFAPNNDSDRWRFNPFRDVPKRQQPLAGAAIVDVFKKLWPDEWGPRLEHLLRNVVYTLLETPDSSLGDIPRLLTDKTYRSRVVAGLETDVVREFWTEEYDRYSQPFRAVVAAPLQNKVGALLTDPRLRRVLTEPGPQLDPRSIMDSGKVFLANLDKGQLGDGPSGLLGSLLLSHMAVTGLARSEQPEVERRNYFLYLDEFQTFTTLSIATMLAELRKYRIGLVLANQYLGQLQPEIRDAVLGNTGSLVAFRVGAGDAAILAKEFAPKLGPEDLANLPRYSMYVRLMIEGATSQGFSAESLDQVPHDRIS